MVQSILLGTSSVEITWFGRERSEDSRKMRDVSPSLARGGSSPGAWSPGEM